MPEDQAPGGTDDEVLEIEVPPLSPRQEANYRIASTARAVAIERRNAATTTSDYLRWQHYGILFTSENVDWRWQYVVPTAEGLIQEVEDPRRIALYENIGEGVEEMRGALNKMEDRQGMIKIVLKEDSYEGFPKIGVLAEYPEDIRVEDPLDSGPPRMREGRDTIYFRPTSACVASACNSLIGADKQRTFYIPYQDRDTLFSQLKTKNGGTYVELMIFDPELGIIPQDQQVFLSYALIGGYGTSEDNRTRISDFWRKAQYTDIATAIT